MPPRFAYWTILVGGLPTAFRATEREELLPTFKRLLEKHPDAVMRWFSRGQLWESPDAARAALIDARRAEHPPRGRDWRPGGAHRDPRQKYIDAKKARNVDRRKQRFERRQNDDRSKGPTERPPGSRPDGPSGWKNRPDRPSGPKPEGRREWKDRPDRPSGPKPEGRREWKDRPDRPSGPKPEGRREWKDRPNRPSGPKPEGRREWKDRPDRPSGPKPEGRREWKDRPRGPRPPGKPAGGRGPDRPAGPRGPRGPKR